MTLNDIMGEMDKPNIATVTKLLNNISLESFTQYFSKLTNREKYFRNVQKSLIKMFKDIRNVDPKRKVDVTLGVMLGIAKEDLDNSDFFDPDDAYFIIEKLIAEPISIINEQSKNNVIKEV